MYKQVLALNNPWKVDMLLNQITELHLSFKLNYIQ